MARTDSQPIRISKQLLADATAVAPTEGRSATAQVEYWAKLGRAADMHPGNGGMRRRIRAKLGEQTDDVNLPRVAAAMRAEISIDDLTPAERVIYLERLDDVIENGGTTEEAAFLAELRAEGGWGADEDGALIRYDGEGNVLCVVEPAAERG